MRPCELKLHYDPDPQWTARAPCQLLDAPRGGRTGAVAHAIALFRMAGEIDRKHQAGAAAARFSAVPCADLVAGRRELTMRTAVGVSPEFGDTAVQIICAGYELWQFILGYPPPIKRRQMLPCSSRS